MITEHEIFLTDPSEKAKVVEFLKGFDLTFTGNIDYTMGLYRHRFPGRPRHAGYCHQREISEEGADPPYYPQPAG